MKLPMVLRDFIGWCPEAYTKNAADSGNTACDNDTSDGIKGHPDFEITPDGTQIDGTVEATLDANGKPVNKNKNVGPNFNPLTPANGNGWTSGQDYFQYWYRDNGTYNRRFNHTVTLTETPTGSNKWVYERNPFWPLDPDPPGTVDPVLDSFTNLPARQGEAARRERNREAQLLLHQRDSVLVPVQAGHERRPIRS